MVQILIEHNVDPFRIDDGEGMPLEMALREGRYEIAELLKDYITVIMIQRNRRRNIKNRKTNTLRNRLIRNKQKLITAKHPDLDFDTSRILGETLHNMPVNPEVYTRMNQERRAEKERARATMRRRQMENTRMANYLDTLDQFGGTRSKSRFPDKVELAQNENMARFLEGLEEFDSDVIGLDDKTSMKSYRGKGEMGIIKGAPEKAYHGDEFWTITADFSKCVRKSKYEVFMLVEGKKYKYKYIFKYKYK